LLSVKKRQEERNFTLQWGEKEVSIIYRALSEATKEQTLKI
jgi:hypothetical protein